MYAKKRFLVALLCAALLGAGSCGRGDPSGSNRQQIRTPNPRRWHRKPELHYLEILFNFPPYSRMASWLSATDPEKREAATFFFREHMPDRHFRYRAIEEGLIACLADDYTEIRVNATYAVGRMKSADAVPGVIANLRDGHRGLQRAALAALAAIGDPRAVAPLIELCDSYSFSLAGANPAEALGDIGDKRAVPTLIRLLHHPHGEARVDAAEALGEIADTAAVGPLIALLDERNEKLVIAAVSALGSIGSRRAIGPLEQLLDHGSEKVVRKARLALRRIRGKRSSRRTSAKPGTG